MLSLRIFSLTYIMSMIAACVAATVRLPLCKSHFQVAYRQLPPYTKTVDNKTDGVLFDVFKAGILSCCKKFDNNPIEFQTSSVDLDHLLEDGAKDILVDFILPIQRSEKTDHYMGHPYVPTIPTPGFALFIPPPANSMAMLLSALRSVVPLLMIAVLAVCIAGVMFWMIENMTLAYLGERPERFNPGVWNGMWWAFITMTTIGYGDVMPKTKPGRIFSVFWILMGIVLCGIVVSQIAAALIDALSPKTASLINRRIGVLSGSEAHTYVFLKQGLSLEFESTDEMAEALRSGHIEMMLMDVLVASHYKSDLRDFILDQIIEHTTSQGVVFVHKGMKYNSCFKEFVLNSQNTIINMISGILRGNPHKSRESVSSSSVINGSSSSLQYTLVGIAIFVILLLLIGLCREKYRSCYKENDVDDTEKMKLMSFYRESYHNELICLLDSLKTKAVNHEVRAGSNAARLGDIG